MARRSQVLKFGSWEDADVPYTAYFEKARSSRSVRTNSNNTRGNLDRPSDNLSTAQALPFHIEIKAGSQKGQEAVRKKHVQSSSPEDGNLRRPSKSLLLHDPANRKLASGLPLHHDGSVSSNCRPKKAIQQSVGSHRRIGHLPLPHNHQASVGGKGRGISRPSLARKSSTEGINNLAPSTPGRSRMRPVTRGNDIPDCNASVPKFGDWDESNPASADGFTRAFSKVRKEKVNGNGMVPVAATQDSSRVQKQHNETPKRCCYFPWCK